MWKKKEGQEQTGDEPSRYLARVDSTGYTGISLETSVVAVTSQSRHRANLVDGPGRICAGSVLCGTAE